jgi:hypothetical protein
MKFSELITDPNGTMSHTKLWSNIGMAVVTVTFCWHVYKRELTSDLMIAYGAIVVFGRAASKYIDSKGNSQSVSIPQEEN